MSKFYFLLFFSMFLSYTLKSQTFEINNETVVTCSGSFQDDNGGVGDDPGAEGGAYSNTSYTYTICPDNPGDVVSVDFLAFNLYTNLNPNNSDYLSIWDGDQSVVGNNDFSMGSYTGNQLNGLPVTGSVSNTSGCLTFVFNPSSVSSGDFPGWEGIIECTTPCAPPTAFSTIADPQPDLENSVSVCLDAPIVFQDNGSFAEIGFTIENYIWNFDDGTIEEGSDLTSVEHSFSEPGEYIVTLIVEDNNGCQNLNLVPLQVLVSTIPVFQTDYTSQLCDGAEGFINGNPVQSQTWTALPPQVVAGETYLADGAGFSYESTLSFDFFEDDQVLESCDDLNGISINMEHSYMGDLDIIITCPDGTSLFLFEQAGGGTYLGEALDDGSNDPGVGYEYVWAPDATSGTWGDNANGVDILPAGIYESNEDMCQLEGCPLNGDWTIEVIDNLAIDNGYIFEWGVDLNPELFPGITTFTPTIGLGLDSTWIEGPNIINSSADGNLADFLPTGVGTYDYTLFASNNFGCTFDTTVTVEVFPQPEVTLPESLIGDLCSDFEIIPEIEMELFSDNPTFEIVLENVNQLGFGGAGVEVFVNGVSVGNFTSTTDLSEFEFSAENGDEITLEYTESGWGSDGNQISIIDSQGSTVYQSNVNPNSGQIYSSVIYNGLEFSWTPAAGLDNPDDLIASGPFTQNTTYELSVFPTGFPVCTVTDEVDIIVLDAPNPGVSSSVEICENAFEEIELIDYLGGTPDAGGTWLDENNNPVAPVLTDAEAEGVYTYSIGVDECQVQSELEVIIHSLSITPINDTTICENGIATLSAQLSSFEYPDVNYFWNNGLYTNQAISVQPILNETMFEVYAEFNNGCFSNTETVQVTTLPPLQMNGLIDDLICLGDSVVLSANNPTGGMEPYNFSWNANVFTSTQDTVTLMPSNTTNYTLEFSDACESTPQIEEFTISLNPVIPATFSTLNNAGCYPITPQFIGDAEALDLISTVVWDFGDGSTSNSLNSASHTYSSPGDYDVSLTIFGVDGCVYEHTEEEIVEAYDVPTAEFAPLEYTVVLPNSTFEFQNYSIGADQSEWTFDAYGTSTETNPEIEFPLETPTDLEIELVSVNNDGCSDTVSYTVFLVDGFALFAPNAFTPDGDGINEVWKIEGIDIDEADYEVYVFNRIGERVYFSTNPKAAWDGSFENGDHFVPNGVYSFIIKTRAKTTGDKKELKGHLTILR